MVQQYESKALQLMKSRKFWAAIAALVTVAGSFATGQIDGTHATYAAMGILGTYIFGTSIEDAGRTPPPPLPPRG